MSEAGSSQSSKTNERKETKIFPITKGKEVVKCNACSKIKRKDEMKNYREITTKAKEIFLPGELLSKEHQVLKHLDLP